MRRKAEKTISILLAAAMTVSMAGCGQKAPKGDAQAAGSTAQAETSTVQPEAGETTAGAVETAPAEITFSWWGGDSRHEATEKAVEAFMKKNPNISVQTEYGAWNGWEEKQTLNLVGGNAADLMQINWNWIDNYSQNGTLFMDLNQYSNIIDLTQYPQSVLDQCTVDGKLMAIPVSTSGCLFYWNQKTFDTIGCELPTDKETLLAAGEKFKAYGEDYYPLVIDSGFSRMIFMVYYLESVYGKPWVENGKLQYTEAEIQDGLDFITELEAAHVIPTLAVTNGDMADSTDKNAKWIDGNYAGAYVWDASYQKMADAVEQSTNVPGQKLVQGEFLKFGDYNGGYTKISMAYAIPASSESPEAAASLIQYLLNDPEGIEICGLERGVPLSAAGASVITEKKIGNQDLIAANKAVLDFSKFPLDPKFDSSDLKAVPDGAYEKVFGKLSAGEFDLGTATKNLFDSVNEVLGN